MSAWWFTPGWIWVIFVILFILTLSIRLASLFFGPKKDSKIAKVEAIQLASQICENAQRIRNIKVRGMVILDLRADSDEMEEVYLAFPRKHPDFYELESLESLAFIRFKLNREPIRKLKPYDATTYLRLKK